MSESVTTTEMEFFLGVGEQITCDELTIFLSEGSYSYVLMLKQLVASFMTCCLFFGVPWISSVLGAMSVLRSDCEPKPTLLEPISRILACIHFYVLMSFYV